jgi:DNA-directed RNA polymerase subunit M/transcription elongation factor TFIIS
MTLNFCPKCGNILIKQQIDKDKSYLFCDKCNHFELFKAKNNPNTSSKEKIKKEKERGKGVTSDKNILATYKHKCSKCGYDKAQILDLGIFYSDEDNLILLKCGKCGFSERIGRKVS